MVAFTEMTAVVAATSSPEKMSSARATRRAEVVESLTSLTIIPEDAYSLKEWNLGTFAAFKPRNSWDEWVTQQATVMMFRISRGERIERRLRDMQALRAFDCWEVDQQLAAEVTASQTNGEPLRMTPAYLWSAFIWWLRTRTRSGSFQRLTRREQGHAQQHDILQQELAGHCR